MKTNFLGFMGILLLAQSAEASNVFKCTTSKGTVYQEVPCAVAASANSKNAAVKTDAPNQKLKVLSDTQTANMSVLKYCLDDGTAIVTCNKDTRTMVETQTRNMSGCK